MEIVIKNRYINRRLINKRPSTTNIVNQFSPANDDN